MYFNSFAFLDLETTSLCRPKITEIALVACERRHLEDSEVLPRVLHKFTVCVKPSMKVHPITTEITGLDNESLMNVGSFSEDVVESLRLFLQRLPPPVCLVAHNGNRFDYPILNREIELSGAPLLEEVYCVDSLPGFREILSRKRPDPPPPPCLALSSAEEDKLCIQALEAYEQSIMDLQLSNEATPAKPLTPVHPLLLAPKKKKQQRIVTGNSTARRRLFENESSSLSDSQIVNVSQPQFELKRTPHSFKLCDLYEYFYGYPPLGEHRAETDAVALLECILKISVEFFDYADRNASLLPSVR